jgi:2',3'-cyclic-nucleotide 2'-phosphodiesterase/3'-nucleotidase
MIQMKKKSLALFALFFIFVAAFANGKKDLSVKKSSDKSFSYDKSGLVIKSPANESDTVQIAVIATSDLHGHIYSWDYAVDSPLNGSGFAQTDSIVKGIKEKYKENLLIDVGDLMQENSSELFNDCDIHPMIQALNFLNYDAWILGNHEFNYGLDFLEKNILGFEGRVISSNIKYADSGKNFVLPYQIYEIQGVRLAVIGCTPTQVTTWEGSTPEHFQNLNFISPMDSVKKTIKSIEGQYDVLVGAFHISREGEFEDEGKGGAFQIAKACPELDLILAGHEHAVYCTEVNGTWVLEPGKFGSHVALATLDLKKKMENGDS